MADKVILIDTSILIDYFRKTEKEKSVWVSLIKQKYSFAISVVTKYEIYSGATLAQQAFWDSVFQELSIIPLDESCVNAAVQINANLKRSRKQIEIADLFIAATATAYNLSLATLNKKHFNRVDTLDIIE